MHTIEIDDDLYRELEARARQSNRTPQDVIRDAIATVEPAPAPPSGHSALDRLSNWKGGLIQPWTSRADMLSDFFERDENDAGA